PAAEEAAPVPPSSAWQPQETGSGRKLQWVCSVPVPLVPGLVRLCCPRSVCLLSLTHWKARRSATASGEVSHLRTSILSLAVPTLYLQNQFSLRMLRHRPASRSD